tara:strand:- start:245 stop:613 length:369 start_codon:yes stop_codon:yes gene_type:complete
MIYTKRDALDSLRGPDADWSWDPLPNYSDLQWDDEKITKPTEAEIDAELKKLTDAEPMRLLRIERTAKLAACDWRASSDLTLPDAWKTYRQALRDLPASATPKVDSDGNLDMSSVTFPTEPS